MPLHGDSRSVSLQPDETVACLMGALRIKLVAEPSLIFTVRIVTAMSRLLSTSVPPRDVHLPLKGRSNIARKARRSAINGMKMCA